MVATCHQCLLCSTEYVHSGIRRSARWIFNLNKHHAEERAGTAKALMNIRRDPSVNVCLWTFEQIALIVWCLLTASKLIRANHLVMRVALTVFSSSRSLDIILASNSQHQDSKILAYISPPEQEKTNIIVQANHEALDGLVKPLSQVQHSWYQESRTLQ